MTDSNGEIRTTLRIPGNWSNPAELMQRLPRGYRLTPEALILPDRTEIEFAPMPPDDQFAQIFRSSCRNPATARELEVVDSYTVNVGLTGPGGSMDSARTIMRAGAAIVQAGGAGVFIDNCALAHGGGDWVSMTEDGGPDALSFAFVAIVRGREELWTMGMHVSGLPDIVMQRSDVDADERQIVEVIRYLFTSDKSVGDGHLLADHDGPRFQARVAEHDRFRSNSPMHNPFGRLRMVSIRRVAEQN